MTRSIIIGTMIGAAILIGGYSVIQGGGQDPGGSGVGNLWIDDDGGTCTRNSTPSAYSDAAACSGLNAAQSAASAGDLVMLRCDEESSCTINTGNTITTNKGAFVTYREEANYTVTLGLWDPINNNPSVTISGGFVRLEGMTIPWLKLDTASVEVIVRNVNGNSFDMFGDREAMISTDWTYAPCAVSSTNAVAQGPYIKNTDGDYIFKDSKIHDQNPTNCWGNFPSDPLHLDCLQPVSGDSFWITNNEFKNCNSDVIIIGDDSIGTADLDNGVIENNFIGGATESGQEINFTNGPSSNCNTWLVRNNSFPDTLDGSYPGNQGDCTAITYYANIITHSDSFLCGGWPTNGAYQMSMSGNLTGCTATGIFMASPTTSADSPGSTELNAQFTNAPADLHLIGTSDAIDAGGPNCPDGDIDGYLRTTCDTGADEYNNTGSGLAPDWYVDDAGNDSNMCTPYFPCLTIDRAFDLASPGDVIGLMSGTYSSQTITGDFAKNSSSHVTIQPVPGASVTISTTLTIDGADHLTVKDVAMSRWVLDNRADDVIMQNLDTNVFTINSTAGALVKGGDVGPYDAFDLAGVEDTQIGQGFNSPSGCGGASGNGTTCTLDIENLTIDGVFFHDYTDVDVPSAHIDCLQFFEGKNVVIKNTKFNNNCGESNDLYIRGDAGPIDGFLIENNWSERTAEDFSFRLSGQSCPGGASSCTPPCKDVTIRNNTVKQRIGTDCNVISTGLIRGNINLGQNSFHCSSNSPPDVWGQSAGWTFEYNVGGSGANPTCGATDISGTPSFVSTTNLHLTGANGVADNALPTPFSATDIDEQSRPQNAQADVGADERNQ